MCYWPNMHYLITFKNIISSTFETYAKIYSNFTKNIHLSTWFPFVRSVRVTASYYGPRKISSFYFPTPATTLNPPTKGQIRLFDSTFTSHNSPAVPNQFHFVVLAAENCLSYIFNSFPRNWLRYFLLSPRRGELLIPLSLSQSAGKKRDDNGIPMEENQSRLCTSSDFFIVF